MLDCYSEIELGTFVIRGENIMVFGEVDKTLPLERVSLEVLREKMHESTVKPDWEIE